MNPEITKWFDDKNIPPGHRQNSFVETYLYLNKMRTKPIGATAWIKALEDEIIDRATFAMTFHGLMPPNPFKVKLGKGVNAINLQVRGLCNAPILMEARIKEAFEENIAASLAGLNLSLLVLISVIPDPLP